MDKHDIRRKALAAREVSEEVEPGVAITLRLPTRQEVAVAAARAGVHRGGPDAEAGLVLMQRELLQAAVVGWGQGVKLSHLLPKEANDPLPWDADLVPLLLDAQPDWETKLRERFVTERLARQARMEDAEKNSPCALPGNSTTQTVRSSETPMATPAGASSTAPSGPG
jgi:hypothetical protein